MEWHKLILYRDLLDDEVIGKSTRLLEMLREPGAAQAIARESLYFEIYSLLVRFSEEQQLPGDIWHNYLVGLLAGDENPFSLTGERGGRNITGPVSAGHPRHGDHPSGFCPGLVGGSPHGGAGCFSAIKQLSARSGGTRLFWAQPAAVGYIPGSGQRADNDGRPAGRIL